MSVISCSEIGRAKRRGRLTDTFFREYYRTFRARTDTPSDDPLTVISQSVAFGFPQIWDPFPTDASALVADVEINEQDGNDPRCWLLQAHYSTGATDKTQQSLDPLDEPAHWTFDTERVEIALRKDYNDEYIVNSATVPYEPPERTEIGLMTVSYQDNVHTFDAGAIPRYVYHANSEPFWDRGIDKVLMIRFRGQRLFRNGVIYWQRNIEWKILDEDDTNYQGTGLWSQIAKLDVGYDILSSNVGAGGTLSLIPASQDGTRPAKPVYLDGRGGLLNGNGILNPGQSPIIFNYINRPQKVDFNDLQLQQLPTTLDMNP